MLGYHMNLQVLFALGTVSTEGARESWFHTTLIGTVTIKVELVLIASTAVWALEWLGLNET